MDAHRRADRSHPAERAKDRTFGITAYAIGVLVGFLAGCAPLPPAASSEASNPHAAVSAVPYKSVIGSYTSRRPVDPTPWRDQNEGMDPTPKP